MLNSKLYAILFLIFVLSGNIIYSQQITNNILSSTFQEYKHEDSKNKRKIIDFRKKTLVQKLNPLLYVGGGLLFVYQRVFSEQIQATCIYKKSCSEYTKHCIEKKGIIKGTLSGFNQLSNCFQGALFERSSYLLTDEGKINNELDEYNQD